MNPSRLVPRDGEPEAGLQRSVVGRDVVAPMPVALLHAQRVERVVAGEAQARSLAAFAEHVEDARSELGRNVDLPAELADVGDAAGANPGIAEIDLLRCAERERFVGEVGRRERLAGTSRELGPITLNTAEPGRDVDCDRSVVQRRCGRFSQWKSRTWVAAAVTIMNRSSASRVTVRSASMPPLSLSHCV